MSTSRMAAAFTCCSMIAAVAFANDASHPDTNRTQETSDPPPQPLVGIGASIMPPPPKDGKQIIGEGGQVFALLPNRPAALSGEINVDDLIIAVAEGDGPAVDVRGMEFSKLINLIRGPAETEVRLTIIPADNRFVKRKIVALVREPLRGEKLVGTAAPDVTFTRLSDGTEEPLSDFTGQVVVLEFWASWCAPCMEHVATMQSYPEEHPHWTDRVALIALSLDKERETSLQLVAKREWNKTHNVWGNETVKRAFDADLLPLVVILDAQGTIAAAGHPRTVNITKIVDELLDQ